MNSNDTPPQKRTLPVHQVFAYRLRDVRLAKRWKQQDLADAMKRIGHPMSRVTITKIEAGAHGASGEIWHEPIKTGQTKPRPVSLDEAVAFAVALGVAPSTLFLPLYEDDDVELAPLVSVDVETAHAWTRGERPLEPAGEAFYRHQAFESKASRAANRPPPITLAQLKALGIRVED